MNKIRCLKSALFSALLVVCMNGCGKDTAEFIPKESVTYEETESQTQKPTEKETEPPTQKQTQQATEPQITTCNHIATTVSCLLPSTCVLCDEVLQEALGHTAGTANCTTAGKCKRCGFILEEPLGHLSSWVTCTKDAVCYRCGEITEKALGHKATEATCTSASVCTRSLCGDVLAPPLGHNLILVENWSVCKLVENCTRCPYSHEVGPLHTPDATGKYCKICHIELE